MNERIEELRLNENYSFFVSVQNNGTHFAGELLLTPTECTLIIRGDILEGRSSEFPFSEIGELACRSFEGIFILYGLRPLNALRRALLGSPSNIWHFEYKYAISHAVFSRRSSSLKVGVRAVEVESASVARWVGATTTQDQIVERHDKGTLFGFTDNIPEEFAQPVGELGTLHVIYKPSTYYSIEDFSMGLRYPPALLLAFSGLKSAAEAVDAFLKLERLFSFLTGQLPDIQIIRLISEGWNMSRDSLSLYMPRAAYVESSRSHHLFPLGINLRRSNNLGLPEFPLNAFNEYFCLTAEDQRYFEKYLIYRDRNNAEERFLGYFRLLEKLCFQKDSFLDEGKLSALTIRATPFLSRYFGDDKNLKRFLKGLPRLNSSKLNTASCIQKFLSSVPAGLRANWRFGPSDIEGICKVRNDLIHANEFEPEEFEMERKAKFIEVLLTIGLLQKLDVSIDTSAAVAPRINGYHLIQRPVEAISQPLSD